MCEKHRSKCKINLIKVFSAPHCSKRQRADFLRWRTYGAFSASTADDISDGRLIQTRMEAFFNWSEKNRIGRLSARAWGALWHGPVLRTLPTPRLVPCGPRHLWPPPRVSGGRASRGVCSVCMGCLYMKVRGGGSIDPTWDYIAFRLLLGVILYMAILYKAILYKAILYSWE